MSLLKNIAGKSILRKNTKKRKTLFQFPNASGDPKKEQEIRDLIHSRIGLKLKDPSTFEPDAFYQEFPHLLPEGFSLDPKVVKKVLVYYCEDEAIFFIVPFSNAEDNGVFSFTISRNKSDEKFFIPTRLLLPKNTGKIMA